MRALRRRSPATFTMSCWTTGPGSASPTSSGCRSTIRLRGANVITTLTAPHSFTAERLAALRAAVPAAIAALPRPRVAVILGGKNKVYEFRAEDDARFAGALKSLGALGASFMITPSRRTHARLLEVTEQATRAFPRILWDGEGPNPYGNSSPMPMRWSSPPTAST